MTAEKASVELREANEAMSSKLKELKSSKKELKEKYDKLERIHNELITSHNMLKEEYTTLKINHDNLVIAQEFLSNEPHDATNDVVKIDIATSCDDLIVESIEQGSSSKGKQVVEANNYDEYVKIKNENEKLKKDLEEIKSHNTIVLETLDHDCGGMAPKTWAAPSEVAQPTRSRHARRCSACTVRHCIVPNMILTL